MCFMLDADKYRFGNLTNDLENQHTQVMIAFTNTISSIFGLLNNWKTSPKLITKVNQNKVIVLHLPKSIKTKSKNTKHSLTTISCLKCQEKWHYLYSCPKDQSDTQILLMGNRAKNSLDEDEFTFFTDMVLRKQSNKR